MVKKIVLTGGPGSGKTTVLEHIKKEFENKGMKVIVVPESATEIINMGVKPFGEDKIDLVEFQKLVLSWQLAKEEIINQSLVMMQNNAQDYLIVYDRGLVDGQAFVSKEEFKSVMNFSCSDKDYFDLLNEYDLVIDLVGREDFYTLENNKARSENVELAMERGQKALQSWMGHERLVIVQPKDTVEEKISEVLTVINNLIEVDGKYKNQIKYIVDLQKSDLNKLFWLSKRVDIEQIYLDSKDNIEYRIRMKMLDGALSYKLSIFETLESGLVRIIKQQSIDQQMYFQLSKLKDDNYDVVKKSRYYFTYEGQYLYLDILDGQEFGIMEFNVIDEENIKIPDYIAVLGKVESQEDKKKYSNKYLALVKKEEYND